MELTQEQKTYAEIVQKAWESPEFKNELTANPVAAIEKLTGNKLNIPVGKTLVVRDQMDESTVYINIPAKSQMDVDVTTIEQQKQSEELIKTLAQKAWESSTFKEQLINNPVSTIELVTGQKMSPEVKLIVEDQTNDSIIYLNIPRKLDLDELELTEEQLETISGGSSPLCYVGLVCLGYGVCAVVDHLRHH